MVEDIKVIIVRGIIDATGSIITNQLSQPDWELRKKNIEMYYKDLEPIRKDLPDAPIIREIPEQRGENGKEKAKLGEIVNQICAPDLSPKELLECKSCVEEVLQNPDVLHRYMKPSL